MMPRALPLQTLGDIARHGLELHVLSTKMVIPSVLTRWPPYPELSAQNLRDARLYATRSDLIAALPVPKGGKVAEIT